VSRPSAAPRRTRAVTRAVTRVLALSLGAACARDPAGPAATPPALRMEVGLPAMWVTDPTRQVYVSGWFTPGRDDAGVLRRVDGPLRVGTEPIDIPVPAQGDGVQFGGRTLSVPVARLRAGPLVVTPPTVSGAAPAVGSVAITTLDKADADTVRPGPDGALRVRLMTVRGDDAGVTRSWSFRVAGVTTLTFDGTGVPPAELVVPRSLLPAPSNGAWRAQLEFQEDHAIAGGAAGYEVTVRGRQALYWDALSPDR
jgi:hypothetical protein